MKVPILYGEHALHLSLNEQHSVSVLQSETNVNRIGMSVAAPICSPLLHDLVSPNDRVVIIVSDITRPCPTKEILPYLLKELKISNIQDDQILIVVGIGLHRPNTPDEMKQIVGEDVFCRIRTINSDPNQTQHVGTTSRGTPLEVFQPVLEADIRIAVGTIDLHYFAGYSGGYKALVAGTCSQKTIP